MKAKQITLALLLATSLAFAENKLEYWTFDTDASGASFDNGHGGILNSGSNASLWNLGKVKGMKADGAGHFVVSRTGSTYRKVPARKYAADQYTSGRYRLVIEFASWDLDPASNGSIAFEVVDANNKRVVGLNLFAEKGTEARIRFSASSAGGWQGSGFDYAGYLANLKEDRTMRLAIEFDLDNDTATYFVNGTVGKTISDFNAISLAQIKFFTDRKWSALGTVKINEMGLLQLPSIVPEAPISL